MKKMSNDIEHVYPIGKEFHEKNNAHNIKNRLESFPDLVQSFGLPEDYQIQILCNPTRYLYFWCLKEYAKLGRDYAPR